ncbi:nicotinate-nucleotide adenylyltransferase [Caldinitratiruptor microaerophilus]|uniref:Probable nicotinate-nucleotide adenylyltransferase n=1 Tax=Caldinitratiruptor microaerophilus TaxID=671077 RepID=A0AA35G8V4_9FIRM|nr:nicotinate-nucleotide adenylyltransferase [Caldinitratiruptor microaerophilus]BDG61461.1 putative nicotinate-nucleotide adenylyltransferase [Caldinitratiruptor microaerophilus]
MGRRRIGVFGGTFDPVHYGHLAAAVGAAWLVGLERVLLVPAGEPPHKTGHPVTPAAHRLAMVRLAAADNPLFEICELELERPGPSYTVDTMAELERRHPDWDLVFLTGLDGLLAIETWHEYRRLLTGWPLVAIVRPGVPLEGWEALRRRLGPELTARVRIVETPGVAVSASDLRARARAGYPLTYLVPPGVEEYIRKNGLYRGHEGGPG